MQKLHKLRLCLYFRFVGFIVLLLSRRLLVSSLPILLMGSIYIYVYGIIYIWTYIFVLFICRFIHLYSFSVFSGVVGFLLVHLVNGQYGGGLGLSWGNLESLSCSYWCTKVRIISEFPDKLFHNFSSLQPWREWLLTSHVLVLKIFTAILLVSTKLLVFQDIYQQLINCLWHNTAWINSQFVLS